MTLFPLFFCFGFWGYVNRSDDKKMVALFVAKAYIVFGAINQIFEFIRVFV